MSETLPAAIELRNVSRSYRNEDVTVDALRDVTLEVPRGEFVAVMGPSGSGKSTLLHLIGGLDRPTAGQVLVNGRRLDGLTRTQLAEVRGREIGFVFQSFNLVPGLTVAENVALPAVLARVRPSAYRARVDELLETVGLTAAQDRHPARLSGGEQQRVAVARALVMAPAVLLADEPTGNLDSRSGEDVLGLIDRCHHAGQTVILVTHDVKVASHAQRVLNLRDGTVADELYPGRRGVRELTRLLEVGEPE